MKRAFPVLLIFLAGCIVQSFCPFYTDKSKITLPQLNGEWDAVITWGDKVTNNIPPWRISATRIIAYGDDSQPAAIDVTLFKLGDQLFCDSIAGGLDDDKKLPWYLAWHVRPLHTVTKVETNGSSLTFIPLNLDWLKNCLATGKVSLPHLTRDEEKDWPLFTATPADWESFLTTYGSDTNAFSTNNIYVLKRRSTPPSH